MEQKKKDELEFLNKHGRELTKKMLSDFDKLIHGLATSMSYYYGDVMPLRHVKEFRDRVVEIWWDVKALDRIEERREGLRNGPDSHNENSEQDLKISK